MTEAPVWRPIGRNEVWFDSISSEDPQDAWGLTASDHIEVRWIFDSEEGHGDDEGAVSVELVEGLPRKLVEAYAEAASRHARITELEPGVWFASVVGLDGAWGDGESPDESRRELREALIGWVAVRRRLGLKIPPIDGHDLNPPGGPEPRA